MARVKSQRTWIFEEMSLDPRFLQKVNVFKVRRKEAKEEREEKERGEEWLL